MSEFIEQLSKFKERMPRIKPWIAIAVVAAVVLAGYNSYQGKLYWEANQEATALTNEINQVSTVLSRKPPSRADLAADVQQRERDMVQLRQHFAFATSDELMGVLSETAYDSGVSLASMSVGEAVRERQGDVRFLKQPFSLTLQGKTDEIMAFLSNLSDRLPVAQVGDIRLTSSATEETVASVQMVFHLSPQVVSQEQEEEDGSD